MNPEPKDRRASLRTVEETESRDAVELKPEPRDEVAPKAPVRFRHRRRAIAFSCATVLAFSAWWGSSYLFAYTDDAYVASDVVSVTPEVTGPVASVAVKDNERVRTGTLLFTIDPVPFKLRLQQAEAVEAGAQAQLPIDQAQVDSLAAEKQVADAGVDLATLDLQRATPLSRSHDISAEAFDNARISREQSLARQRSASAALDRAAETARFHRVAVASAHAATLLSQWQLSRTRVLAPVDGSVTNLGLQPGDNVSPGHPALAIVDANAWRVMANYKEYYLRHLSPGHAAWVWLDTRPWHLYRARIQGVSHGISRDQGPSSLVPYVSPSVDWIRLQRRIPVRVSLVDGPPPDQLFMGADARVLVLY